MTQAYPLAWPDGWPRTRLRKSGKFLSRNRTKISIQDATARVWDELERLGVKHPRDDSVISTNLRLNMSGYPRGDQGEPTDPGVAVYWSVPKQPPRVMAIDAYYRVADNIAAIAATLDAMRAIERHGGATILERAFTGFTALAPPEEPWWQVLGVRPDASLVEIGEAHRRAAKRCHPDLGGSDAAMARINIARDKGIAARTLE